MVSLKTSQIHIVLGDDKTIIRSALKEDLKVLKVLVYGGASDHDVVQGDENKVLVATHIVNEPLESLDMRQNS